MRKIPDMKPNARDTTVVTTPSKKVTLVAKDDQVKEVLRKFA